MAKKSVHPEDERLRAMGFTPIPAEKFSVPRRAGGVGKHAPLDRLQKRQFGMMIGNLENSWKRSGHLQETGSSWYLRAHHLAGMLGTLAQERGHADRGVDPVRIGAGLLSATSPNTDWDLNRIQAHEMAKYGDIRTPTREMQDRLKKSKQIFAGEDPNDVLPTHVKTGNFYRNILNPFDPHSVTIDAHAHDVAVATKSGRSRPYAGGADNRGSLSSGGQGLGNGRYDYFKAAYLAAAHNLGVVPSHLQATTWEHWRGLYPRASGRQYDPSRI